MIDIKCCVDGLDSVQIYIDGIEQPMFYDERDRGYVTELEVDGEQHSITIVRQSLLLTSAWLFNTVQCVVDLFSFASSNFDSVYTPSITFEVLPYAQSNIVVRLRDGAFRLSRGSKNKVDTVQYCNTIQKKCLDRWKVSALISSNAILLFFTGMMLMLFFQSGLQHLFSCLYLTGAVVFAGADIIFCKEILAKYKKHRKEAEGI